MHETQIRAFNVLIVDDDSDTRECLREAITMHGLSVMTANSGLDALSALLDGVRPEVALLDVHMPRLGGLAFLSRLLATPALQHLPVILMTGDDRPMPPEVVAVLRKPFSIEQLIGTVTPYVRRSSSENT